MPGYFLDTSAFAKLYHLEAGSEFVERIVAIRGSALVSRLALVEIESVFAIKVRTGNWINRGRNWRDGGSGQIFLKGEFVSARP